MFCVLKPSSLCCGGSVFCSTDRQMMLCGMHSGFIRVYPLQPNDYSLKSMKAYWALSVHDNQYGHLHHIKWSHDDQFVLTAGNDGNIFSFSLAPPSELQERLHTMRVKVPSPRVSSYSVSLDFAQQQNYVTLRSFQVSLILLATFSLAKTASDKILASVSVVFKDCSCLCLKSLLTPNHSELVDISLASYRSC